MHVGEETLYVYRGFVGKICHLIL